MTGCDACDQGKSVHIYKRRRTAPMVCVSGADAIERPSGALTHMDWIDIKRDTPAYRTARRALMLTDDQTAFLGASPSDSKEADAVIEAVHRFDNVVPEIRRWWTDRAA